ncbi:aldehyde ferredoxin oxidoreductase [Shewanella abyssi]|uniref:aldehyde ferredoxin oxidoreductase N-terminal domain-containing protein n=1 Tax=Shewanella abyssi TaxID=311789 RepID=UPI0020102A2D|nr:aldehyde ferredoxin oxidoreductase N-terminal domain-containing protein [Shewanella abyssi]MCL1050652.1 aldehyde ferredoxin oxidoreductase [Shewanella abyssi]
MKLKGYAGKILHVDLTNLTTHIIPTDKYQRWGGGHGIGAALFWDLCKDLESITDGRDERNVVTLATSPFSGTNVPSAGGRTEVTGIGTGIKPINWFARSNFGGQFSAMLKHAGWDAVTITGKAPHPVYLDIRNDKVMIRDAAELWGKDTYDTQQIIQDDVASVEATAGWNALSDGNEIGRTTQKAAVVAIGPAGENQSVFGCLVHGSGHGSGQCGFGAVFGSKNLKAISAMGTGFVDIADPAALVQARFKTRELYASDADDHKLPEVAQGESQTFMPGAAMGFHPLGGAARPLIFAQINDQHRSVGCHGCINGCKQRRDGYGNESHCQVTAWYLPPALIATRGPEAAHISIFSNREDIAEIQMYAAELVQRLGINSYPLTDGCLWLGILAQYGLVGPGKPIESSLRWDLYGSMEFAKQFCEAIAHRTDIGELLSEGFVEAAKKVERFEDVRTGNILQYPYWGMPEHGYDPRAELTWGYSTLMDSRDVNDHTFNWMFWQVNYEAAAGLKHRVDAPTMVKLYAEKMIPYANNRPEVLDFSEKNMYSEDIARAVQWQMHYNRFYKNSLLLCDFRWPDMVNINRPDFRGATADPEVGEQVYWNAITGENIDFAEGIRRGRQIYNLDNAIWALQGRHREMVTFQDYIFESKFKKSKFGGYLWPCTDDNGDWGYHNVVGRKLDREGLEQWKDHYYRLEGWDKASGWPTRSLLSELDMGFVADRLERSGKLGAES